VRSAVQALGHAVVLLAVATLLAIAGAAAVVVVVARADFLTGAARAVVEVALGSGVLAVAAAASPLVATLLIGYAYMQRGIRRRAVERAAGVAPGDLAARLGPP
jgi:hypothetical protein